MSYTYDDGGLPGEGGHRDEYDEYEPEVALEDAPDCPVHGRDWLAVVDGEVICAAPCPSDAGSMECRWYEFGPRQSRAIEAEAIAIRTGKPASDFDWVDVDALRRDIAAVSGDLAPLLHHLAAQSAEDGALREALLEAAAQQADRHPVVK